MTGYNIAYSMGIMFDRILDGFDGPFEKVNGLQNRFRVRRWRC